MPALNLPKYGVDALHLFPCYQTREAYQQATGQEAPPFNPAKPPKSWFDPKAKESAKRSVVYPTVIALGERGIPLATPDGKPMLDVLVLSRDDAASVNIPPRGPGCTNVAGADAPEVPVPLRELEPDEELFFALPGVVAVKNTTLYRALEIGFTAQDRETLRAIARKLGV